MERRTSWYRNHQFWLELFVLVNLAFLAPDIYVAHSTNLFRHTAEYLPFVFSLIAPVMLLAALFAWKWQPLLTPRRQPERCTTDARRWRSDRFSMQEQRTSHRGTRQPQPSDPTQDPGEELPRHCHLRQLEGYRLAPQELTQKVLGRALLLSAGPPHRHQVRLRSRADPGPAAAPDLAQDNADLVILYPDCTSNKRPRSDRLPHRRRLRDVRDSRDRQDSRRIPVQTTKKRSDRQVQSPGHVPAGRPHIRV
jgi:hypothetical protein